jgi:hypothetical protein
MAGFVWDQLALTATSSGEGDLKILNIARIGRVRRA